MSLPDALAALHARLRAHSGFADGAVGEERLRMLLASRAIELRVASAEEVARRALSDAEEYGRIEAHFAPAETWLFRYPESFELVRETARSRGGAAMRALVLGAGGWCEPVGLATALTAGGCARPSVLAVDRHAPLFARPARFAGIDLRGGVPSWSDCGLVREGDALVPKPAIQASIAVSIGDVGAVSRELADRGERFDLVAFRNVAIYLHDEARAALFAAIPRVLAPGGLLLMGHAEIPAAASATGLVPHPMQGAFALRAGPASPAPREPAVRSAPEPVRVVPAAARPERPVRNTPAPGPLDRLRSELAADPSSAPLHARLAIALAEQGDRIGALEAAMRALYLDRNNEEALLLAARISEERGALGDAERFRQRALRVHLEAERARRADPGRDA